MCLVLGIFLILQCRICIFCVLYGCVCLICEFCVLFFGDVFIDLIDQCLYSLHLKFIESLLEAATISELKGLQFNNAPPTQKSENPVSGMMCTAVGFA